MTAHILALIDKLQTSLPSLRALSVAIHLRDGQEVNSFQELLSFLTPRWIATLSARNDDADRFFVIGNGRK